MERTLGVKTSAKTSLRRELSLNPHGQLASIVTPAQKCAKLHVYT